MTIKDQEVEVKFYINNLHALEQKLKQRKGELIQQRVHEINYRYDLPDGSLTKNQRVLRLRQDQHAVLTYKGPAQPGQTVSVRKEIEIEVSSFSSTKSILEALGYQVSMIYEKQRTTYLLRNIHVTLDEMPYGNFIELEGPDAASIQAMAGELGLDWDARVLGSYLGLFGQVKEKLNLTARHLTFDEVAQVRITAEELGVRPADLQVSL